MDALTTVRRKYTVHAQVLVKSSSSVAFSRYADTMCRSLHIRDKLCRSRALFGSHLPLPRKFGIDLILLDQYRKFGAPKKEPGKITPKKGRDRSLAPRRSLLLTVSVFSLLAGSGQVRGLRAADCAIPDLQRSRQCPCLCRRENHVDRAFRRARQTGTAGG
jgi:hypothetical protein